MSRLKPYYEHAGITIYHGDCREILPQIGRVDLVLTDPPYGIGITRKSNNYGAVTAVSRKADLSTWDDCVPSKWLIELAKDISTNQIIFGANYFWECFYSSQCYLVWDKRGTLPEVPFCDTEFAWTSFTKRASKRYVVVNHGFITDAKEYREHPTQKPLKLFTEILRDFSIPSELVLDPFMGSGTTLRAAKDLGRRAIGIEIEEKYCEIAAKRLSQEVLNFEQESR